MKFSASLLTLFAVTLAFKVPGFGFFDENVVQLGHDSFNMDSLAEKSSEFLSYLRNLESEMAKAPEQDRHLLRSAWKELAKMSPSKQLEYLRRYQSKFHVNQDQMNNKVVATQNDDQYETVTSQRFEGYSLSIAKTKPESLGLDTVKQHTGYLDVDALDKHFFYWFFESRNDPENDPIILWLNGGPGCSSSTGLLFELGPSFIDSKLKPVYNPYSWNTNASVIFLDQPVGVGYSYSNGEQITNTAAAAKDVFVFLELFFQKFPQFLNNKFHISGESYAGHYIPSFASEIVNRADRTFELSSVLIGNGITDALIQHASYKPMGCGEGGYKQVLSDETCDLMDGIYKRCAALTKLCYNAPSALTCVPPTVYCNKLMEPFMDLGLNPYDIRRQCDDDGGLCYVEMSWLDDYLNLDEVKKAVGSKVDLFTSCDDTVFNNFILSGDEAKPFQQYVAELLEKGVPVLLYAGDKDIICNWLGNHYWSDALDYSEHEAFSSAPLVPWVNNQGEQAGEVKNHGIFTCLRVYDAGHMVPHDQPYNALEMVNRWVSGNYNFQ